MEEEDNVTDEERNDEERDETKISDIESSESANHISNPIGGRGISNHDAVFNHFPQLTCIVIPSDHEQQGSAEPTGRGAGMDYVHKKPSESDDDEYVYQVPVKSYSDEYVYNAPLKSDDEDKCESLVYQEAKHDSPAYQPGVKVTILLDETITWSTKRQTRLRPAGRDPDDNKDQCLCCAIM